MSRKIWIGWLAFSLFLAGCAPTALAVLPTPTVVPTADAPSLQITVYPTAAPPENGTAVPPTAQPSPTATITAVTPSPTLPPLPVSLPTATPEPAPVSDILGYSFNGHPLTVYRLGQGPTPLVLIGGIHGGYEWNTVLLAYALLDYFAERMEIIPPDVSLYIIPDANPDGIYRVTGKTGRFTAADIRGDTAPGRFNGRDVDLNRNWDCDWTPQAVWRRQPVSAGAAPFSEPETVALRDFFLAVRPTAVIFYHSAANAVFVGGCAEPWPPAVALGQLYGQAANYPVHDSFYHYPVTGDASDWLAIQGIPAISVELINHTDLDWAQNLAGVLALLEAHRSAPIPLEDAAHDLR